MSGLLTKMHLNAYAYRLSNDFGTLCIVNVGSKPLSFTFFLRFSSFLHSLYKVFQNNCKVLTSVYKVFQNSCLLCNSVQDCETQDTQERILCWDKVTNDYVLHNGQIRCSFFPAKYLSSTRIPSNKR